MRTLSFICLCFPLLISCGGPLPGEEGKTGGAGAPGAPGAMGAMGAAGRDGKDAVTAGSRLRPLWLVGSDGSRVATLWMLDTTTGKRCGLVPVSGTWETATAFACGDVRFSPE